MSLPDEDGDSPPPQISGCGGVLVSFSAGSEALEVPNLQPPSTRSSPLVPGALPTRTEPLGAAPAHPRRGKGLPSRSRHVQRQSQGRARPRPTGSGVARPGMFLAPTAPVPHQGGTSRLHGVTRCHLDPVMSLWPCRSLPAWSRFPRSRFPDTVGHRDVPAQPTLTPPAQPAPSKGL